MSAIVAASIASPASAASILGPDAAACRPGSDQPALLVNVEGFRKQTGSIRVQLHGSDARTWLEPNKWMRRIELPVSAAVMRVCMKLPAPGRYAVAVRHDEDGDGKMTSKDGGGYSRNPKLTIFKLRPSYDAAALQASEGRTDITVTMQYLSGMNIGPVKAR